MQARRLAIFASLTVLAFATAPASSTPGASDDYVGGGNLVVAASLLGPLGVSLPLAAGPVTSNVDALLGPGPLVDSGVITCMKAKPVPSIGGGCVPFGVGNSILVTDMNAGLEVAYQVCLDNNGDGSCSLTTPAARVAAGACVVVGTSTTCEREAADIGLPSGPCDDELFFSHSDDGAFHNPLGPLPTDFKDGCPGGSWRGYVVILCEGVHATAAPHVHPVVAGSITATTGGTGYGTFCGAPGPQAKLYQVA